MSDDADNAGVGLIAGLAIAAVVILLAIGIGPRFFTAGPSDVNVEVAAPPAPAPNG